MPKNLDLNIATERELASIQGMNQYIAGRIVEYRNQNGQFKGWEDLKQVPGLPGNTLETLKAHGCTVGGKAA
jgi:competence protein ComEA